MIEKLGVAGALVVAVWLLGVGIGHAGGDGFVRSGGREGVLTPETPISLDTIASRGIRHTALVSLNLPKVTSIDPGSVRVTTPGYTLDDARATPIVEFRAEKNPKPRSLLVLMDNSNSMIQGDTASDPNYRRIDAVRLLFEALPATDRVSLACFPCRRSVDDQSRTDDTARPYEVITAAVAPQKASTDVEKLRDEENGSTPLYRAIVAGAQTLAASPGGRRRVMVLLTDGKNSDQLSPSLAKTIAAVRDAGVEVYAVGLGKDADVATLRTITPHVLRADDAATLGRTFREIVQQMSRSVVEVDLDVIVGRMGKPIPPGRSVEIAFRSNGRLYTTKGTTK